MGSADAPQGMSPSLVAWLVALCGRITDFFGCCVSTVEKDELNSNYSGFSDHEGEDIGPEGHEEHEGEEGMPYPQGHQHNYLYELWRKQQLRVNEPSKTSSMAAAAQAEVERLREQLEAERAARAQEKPPMAKPVPPRMALQAYLAGMTGAAGTKGREVGDGLGKDTACRH